MKATILIACAVLASFSIAAQTKSPVSEAALRHAGGGPPSVKRLPWRPVSRDWSSTEWLANEVATNHIGEITGQLQHRYIELGDGLNYVDEAGKWRSSKDVVELTETGAAAVHGPTKVYFANNLNQEAAITIFARSNTVLRLRPLGLFYFDAESGESVQIASVQDCEGELLPPNRLVYHSALKSLRADFRYTWSKGTFESDLVLLENPPAPEVFGLKSRTARLEVWHVFADEPRAQRRSVVLDGEPDPLLRASMAEPDVIDETLSCGDLLLPRGHAFSLSGKEKDNGRVVVPRPELPGKARPGRVAVAKRLVRIGNRVGLVESVPWTKVQSQLEALPQPREEAALRDRRPPVKGRPLPVLEMAAVSPGPMKVATAAYDPVGFCLDYITVSGSGSYSFAANTTYHISGPVSFEN